MWNDESAQGIQKNAIFAPMWKYLKSREFRWTALAIIGGLMLLFVLFFFVFLPFYTNHGASVQVPNLSKLTLDEAILELEERDLRYEVVDSLYDGNMEPLAIISQDPIAKSKVKPGRRIYLTINKKVPPKVKLPNVVGVSAYQAKLRLEGSNLAIGKQEFVPYQYANLVISVSYKGRALKGGEELPKFAKVDLIIGKGSGSSRVAIPDLVGMSIDQAVATLTRMNMGISRHYNPAQAGDPGIVYQQDPRYYPGDSINDGKEFVLFISGEEPEETIEGFNSGTDSLGNE